MGTVVLIILTAIVVEFGAHVIIHAVTGRGGLNDPPFRIYAELFAEWRAHAKARRAERMLEAEAERNRLYRPANNRSEGDAA